MIYATHAVAPTPARKRAGYGYEAGLRRLDQAAQVAFVNLAEGFSPPGMEPPCNSCDLHDLRGGRFNVAYSLRQHGTSYFLFIVFALCERKNDKH